LVEPLEQGVSEDVIGGTRRSERAPRRRQFNPLSQSVVDALSSSPGRRGSGAAQDDGDAEETLAEYAMSAYQVRDGRLY
jgi:hypothetical protein